MKQNRLPARVVSSMRDSQPCGVTHAGQVVLGIYSMLGVKHGLRMCDTRNYPETAPCLLVHHQILFCVSISEQRECRSQFTVAAQ